MTGDILFKCAFLTLMVSFVLAQNMFTADEHVRVRRASKSPSTYPGSGVSLLTEDNIYSQPGQCSDTVCPAVERKNWTALFPGWFHTKEELVQMMQKQREKQARDSVVHTRTKRSEGQCNEDEVAHYSACCITCISYAAQTGMVELLNGENAQVVEYAGYYQFFPQARCLSNECQFPCLIEEVPHTLLVYDPLEPDVPFFAVVWSSGHCYCSDV